MTTIKKIAVFGYGLVYNVFQKERDVKREIEEKGLEKFLEDNKLVEHQKRRALAN
jgi:hypothetical protein